MTPLLLLGLGLLVGSVVTGALVRRGGIGRGEAISAGPASDDERARELARDVSRRIREKLEIEDLLDEVVRSLGSGVDVDNAYVRLAEKDGTCRFAAQWVGSRGIRLPRNLPTVLDVDLAHLRSHTEGCSSLALTDLRKDPRFASDSGRAFLAVTRAKSLLLVPVGAGDGLVGSVTLVRSRSSRPFSSADVVLVEGVAYALARGLQAADVHRQQRDLVARLQELDRSKSEFVSSVSHELRTPLTSISGYAEMLLDGDAGEVTADQREMLEVMQLSIGRLQRLIDDLLTIGRIESNRLQMSEDLVDVAGLLRAVDVAMRPQARAAGLRLEIRKPKPELLVTGDQLKLEQVLLNLVSNAVKFTLPGGRVTLRSTYVNGSAVIEVADKGVGIPEVEQDQLFTRFFRASNAIERASQGAGLGLSIVRGLVEAHGGTVSLRSKPGTGTTVTVTLPRASQVTEEAAEELELSMAEREQTGSRTG